MNTRSPGKPNTGPPSVNVEPARQQPSGPNRRHQIATRQNPLPRTSRQARALVVVAARARIQWREVRQKSLLSNLFCLRSDRRRRGANSFSPEVCL